MSKTNVNSIVLRNASDGYGAGAGDGSGDGYGSGCGNGYGAGAIAGYRCGAGSGDGAGDGDGYGDGSGDGSGFRYGDGYGDRYGDGYGDGVIALKRNMRWSKNPPQERKNKMTPKEAYEVLREFQMWRRGEGKYKWSETPSENEPLPYSAKTVGIALDVAIEKLKKEVEK